MSASPAQNCSGVDARARQRLVVDEVAQDRLDLQAAELDVGGLGHGPSLRSRELSSETSE